MKTTFLAVCAVWCATFTSLPIQANPYVWDNENGNGIWNDPVNWGLPTNTLYNVEPTAVDTAIFNSSSPGGIVTLTGDAFAARVRHVRARARIITINDGELVNRTLTLTGTSPELFDCADATTDLTLDGTPTWNGAKLKLRINDSGSGGTKVNGGVTLAVNCDVSGAGGFILNAGSSGAGRLVLGGSNTYTGPTTVNAGTLLVNGSTVPASAVSIASGATLGGNGVIGGSVTVATSGILSPGTSVGTLAINGNLTLSGKLQIEVDKSLTQSNDLITVNGTLSNAGSGSVTVNNLNPNLPLAPGDRFKLFNKPLANGGAMTIVSSGGEIWTNNLAVDGSIAVLPTTNLPPAPTALAATSLTSNGFTANWSSSTGATGYRLDVSTNSLFSSFVSGYQNLDAGNVLSSNVSRSRWGPTNYYRVRAYNAIGTSGNSATIVVPTFSTPVSGDPTKTYIWNCTSDTDQNLGSPANWVGGVAPKPGSSNIMVFRGDVLVPWNWPHIDTNYGTTILIFSNDVRLNGIKLTAGMNHTMNLGSYVLNDHPTPAQWYCFFGVDSPIKIQWSRDGGGVFWVTNANFTNALGDASCGGQTDFKCVGGRLDVYGVLKDGLGAHSKLVKSGDKALNITGQWPNTYTGGTIVNAGPIMMAKPGGFAAIPGDVTVNGSGRLLDNSLGGDQIAHTAIVTLNDSGGFDLGGKAYRVQTVQGASANAYVTNVNRTLMVAPLSGGTYNSGMGVSDFSGSISGSGTLVKIGTGTYGMLGANSVANLTVYLGTLKVNGNSGTGPVAVNTGGTLLGKGTISGAVTVASGATIGAGLSVGKLTLPASLNMSASGNGATNVWELAALKDNTMGIAGTDFDQIVLTGGTLTLGASANLDIRFTGSASVPNANDPFWQTAHSWTVISLSGGSNPTSSKFGRIKNGSYAAGNFTTTATASGILLTYTPSVPSRITSVAVGAGSFTMNYTNTVSGKTYFLVSCTNLNSPVWFTAGSKTAGGTADFQSDNFSTNGQRYYRIYYVAP